MCTAISNCNLETCTTATNRVCSRCEGTVQERVGYRAYVPSSDKRACNSKLFRLDFNLSTWERLYVSRKTVKLSKAIICLLRKEWVNIVPNEWMVNSLLTQPPLYDFLNVNEASKLITVCKCLISLCC